MSAQLSKWITVRAASRRLGIPLHKMQELVRLGLVETLVLPRSRPLIAVEDLERLRQEAHRPAVRAELAEAMA